MVQVARGAFIHLRYHAALPARAHFIHISGFSAGIGRPHIPRDKGSARGNAAQRRPGRHRLPWPAKLLHPVLFAEAANCLFLPAPRRRRTTTVRSTPSHRSPDACGSRAIPRPDAHVDPGTTPFAQVSSKETPKSRWRLPHLGSLRDLRPITDRGRPTDAVRNGRKARRRRRLPLIAGKPDAIKRRVSIETANTIVRGRRDCGAGYSPSPHTRQTQSEHNPADGAPAFAPPNECRATDNPFRRPHGTRAVERGIRDRGRLVIRSRWLPGDETAKRRHLATQPPIGRWGLRPRRRSTPQGGGRSRSTAAIARPRKASGASRR